MGFPSPGVSRDLEVLGLLLSPGTKPCTELESDLSQAQDHTGAASSWPGAWELMSGRALGMDISPPSLLPGMEETEGEFQVGWGCLLAFLPASFVNLSDIPAAVGLGLRKTQN